MRFWSGSLLLGLLIVLNLQSCVEGQHGAKGPKTCCFSFYQKRIPARNIVNYEETDFGCPKPALIFITRKGKRVCVNPKLGWVQRVRGKIDWKPVESSN
ncbi:C-C motif chemokine 3-like [Astyanax mexicanus]|uniref:C-C motif chemokine 3-like n=1 Tax=Astyanax mexicanus TaxID=7994 RepID=UPI0020CAA391|nr:C-C motif chemokine 3-like [Astyanax mexicanus]